MSSCRLLFFIFIVLYSRLLDAATGQGFTSPPTVSSTGAEDVGSSTPAPGGTAVPGSPSPGSTAVPGSPSPGSTEVPSPTTEVPSPTTASPSPLPPDGETAGNGCLCDLTPNFCDIGCCCDTVDCGVANLSTVFTGCPQKPISGVCIEKWLMFRANVDESLVTETDSLFCVQSEDTTAQSVQDVSPSAALGLSYHFSAPTPLSSSSYSRPFYRVDDVIQTFMSNSSVRGFLRQPSPGPFAAFCLSRNPAKFLRSGSQFCSRTVTPQSCATDPTLSARSYFTDLSLLKIPVEEGTPVLDILIPVTPASQWPTPVQQNRSCVNVVKQVEFVIGYTARGELTFTTVNIVLDDVDSNQVLLQTHSVQFQLDTPRSTAGGPVPAVGLRVGSPLIARFDGRVETLTTLRASQSGDCSFDRSTRTPILFTHNSISGCTFSSSSSNCSELRSHILEVLRGLSVPGEIAMDSGSKPSWTRVITQDCPVSSQETCDSGCLLPKSLSIQVLWARQGRTDLSLNYILGAKLIFKCQLFQCPLASPLTLSTDVTFADATLYPNPPRGSPQPDWRLPFGFFMRGRAEVDEHIVPNSSSSRDPVKVTWSLVLFMVTFAALEFFTM